MGGDRVSDVPPQCSGSTRKSPQVAQQSEDDSDALLSETESPTVLPNGDTVYAVTHGQMATHNTARKRIDLLVEGDSRCRRSARPAEQGHAAPNAVSDGVTWAHSKCDDDSTAGKAPRDGSLCNVVGEERREVRGLV